MKRTGFAAPTLGLFGRRQALNLFEPRRPELSKRFAALKSGLFDRRQTPNLSEPRRPELAKRTESGAPTLGQFGTTQKAQKSSEQL